MPNNAASLSTYTTMMRVTSTGRPYCQDLNDLFAALMIQHGLRDHRYRFRTIPASFMFSEVIDVLGHLQFTHVMKTPDPANPSRLIATRTTTTFSMSPNMARTLAQFFATSRLIENAVDPTNRVMKDKAIWVLTPKGKFALQNFSRRAQVSIESLQPALAKVDSFDIVVLERLPDHDDKLAFARPNMTVAFKTLMAYLPLESLLADDAGGIDKEDLEEYRYAFYGYQAFEWISEYTTVVTREEAEMVAAEFVLYGWISQVLDKSDSENNKRDDSVIFKMTRNTLYHVTLRGRQVLGWDKPKQSPSHSQLEDHEYIIKKQKALAARLKTGDMPTPTIQSVPAKSKLTVQSSAASTTSVSTESSSVSSDSISSTQQTATDSDNATVTKFTGNEQLEINMPGEQPADMKATKPKDNLDEVTEKLLQLRSPSDHGSGFGSGGGEDSTTIKMKRIESEDGQQTSTTIVSSSSSSPSRPSSMVFASAFAAQDTTDFITSAPLDGNQQLDPHSHWAKLRQILEDPLVRMYFRDFMKSQFCEENVNIWVDYHTLRKKCRKGSAPPKELLKDAFVIYDTYLAPGAKSEVNIDHSLRQEIISYITSVFEIRDVDGQAQSGSVPFMTSAYQPQPQQITIVLTGNTNECLRTLLKLYDRVNEHICRIMAQDSVPKFIKTNKYRELMANPPPPMCHDSTESGH